MAMFFAPLLLALPLPEAFVALNSTEGMRLLNDAATLRTAYEQTSIHFVSQADEGSCFRASATIVLNALSAAGVGAPVARQYHVPVPYPYWTQDQVVSSSCAASNCTDKFCRGTSLEVATRVLACEAGVGAQEFHARDPAFETVASLRTKLRDTVGTPGKYLIANFIGKPMGIDHYGHYSPIVAFNPTEDAVLVLDVSRYKFPPWWTKVSNLWKGLDSVDDGSDSPKRRGVISVWARSR